MQKKIGNYYLELEEYEAEKTPGFVMLHILPCRRGEGEKKMYLENTEHAALWFKRLKLPDVNYFYSQLIDGQKIAADQSLHTKIL